MGRTRAAAAIALAAQMAATLAWGQECVPGWSIARLRRPGGDRVVVAVRRPDPLPPEVLVLEGGEWTSIGSAGMSSISLLAPGAGAVEHWLFAAGAAAPGRGALARWDGRGWTTITNEVYGSVRGVAVLSEPDGSVSVFVGGNFAEAQEGEPSANLAQFTICPAALCYANCDSSTAPPVLNVGDFICFQQRFVAGDAWADCDPTGVPGLNVLDLVCFQRRFAAGCP
jgi:hypothetical protein